MSREIVRTGWELYRDTFAPPRSTPGALEELRQAYFSGAAVLFRSIMATLDAGDEPTARDLARMDEISKEIDAFARSLDRRYLPKRGNS